MTRKRRTFRTYLQDTARRGGWRARLWERIDRTAHIQRLAARVMDREAHAWLASLPQGKLVERKINDDKVASAHRPLTPRELEAHGYVQCDGRTGWWEKP